MAKKDGLNGVPQRSRLNHYMCYMDFGRTRVDFGDTGVFYYDGLTENPRRFDEIAGRYMTQAEGAEHRAFLTDPMRRANKHHLPNLSEFKGSVTLVDKRIAWIGRMNVWAWASGYDLSPLSKGFGPAARYAWRSYLHFQRRNTFLNRLLRSF